MKEKQRLRVFETRVLEKIVGTKRGRLHNEELQDSYSTPNYLGDQIKKNETGGQERGDRVLVEKPKENKPLGRPKRRWEDNIKRDLKEIGWGHELD
jgi:hypothetical protein